MSPLLEWYAQNGRHNLPWRTTRDPYRIYLSEIMLQQTTVATILKRYAPFLERFPTFASVAQASLDDLLKAWEGLGYYARVRNFHRAALLSKGVMPVSIEGLTALPGIGKTTAHAIASFAYGAQVPILDANVRRIVQRYYGRQSDKELWEGVWTLLGQMPAHDFNQAMMDLGASLCLPKTPHCASCPLAEGCGGHPLPPKKKSVRPVEYLRIVVASDPEGRYWLCQSDKRLLGGLWGFPQYPADTTSVELDGYSYELSEASASVRHIYSHFEVRGKIVRLYLPLPLAQGFTSVQIEDLALSVLDRKAAAALQAAGEW